MKAGINPETTTTGCYAHGFDIVETYAMRTNIALSDSVIDEAMKATAPGTMKESDT